MIPVSWFERLLKDHRDLRLLITVAKVEAVCGLAGAARGDSNLLRSLAAAPIFGSFTEALPMPPPRTPSRTTRPPMRPKTSDCRCHASETSVHATTWPSSSATNAAWSGREASPFTSSNLFRGALIPQLRHQFGDSDGILGAYRANVHLAILGHPLPPFSSK